jgi:hypothetical protein
MTEQLVTELMVFGAVEIVKQDAIGRPFTAVDMGLATCLYRRLPALVLRHRWRDEESKRDGLCVVGIRGEVFDSSPVRLVDFAWSEIQQAR